MASMTIPTRSLRRGDQVLIFGQTFVIRDVDSDGPGWALVTARHDVPGAASSDWDARTDRYPANLLWRVIGNDRYQA